MCNDCWRSNPSVASVFWWTDHSSVFTIRYFINHLPPRWVKIFRLLFTLTREFVSERSCFLCLLKQEVTFAGSFACLSVFTFEQSRRINLSFAILIACTWRRFGNFFKLNKAVAKCDLLRLTAFVFLRVPRFEALDCLLRAIFYQRIEKKFILHRYIPSFRKLWRWKRYSQCFVSKDYSRFY